LHDGLFTAILKLIFRYKIFDKHKKTRHQRVFYSSYCNTKLLGCASTKTLVETIDTAANVYIFLLTRIERVARRTGVNVHVFT
jgi:hypothetical protein